MTFWELLCAAKKIYDLYGYIESKLTDQISVIMQNIAQKELESAIKTLADSKISSNKEREFASAITQLRLALEKTDEKLVKAKITAVIAFCYSVLNEAHLAQSYEENSLRYFDSYYDSKLTAITNETTIANGLIGSVRSVKVAMLTSLIAEYNQLVDYAKDFGLDVDESKIDFGEGALMASALMLVPLSLPFDLTGIGPRTSRLVQKAKRQYAKNLRDSLPR
jgi:hypothetical protein